MKLISALVASLVFFPLTPSAEAAQPRCLGKRATVVGSPGSDFVRATDEPDVIVTGDGDDVIEGVEYGDRVCSGRGADRITGRGGELKGGRGGDYIRAPLADAYGGRGHDILKAAYGRVYGGPGNDRLMAGYIIDGGAGDDRMIASEDCHPRMIPGAGDDFILGDEGLCLGDDVLGSKLDLTNAPGGVRVDLAKNTLTGWGTDTIRGVRSVYGSRFGDVLVGDFRRNNLTGQGGDDVLVGAGGRDDLAGDDFYAEGEGEGGTAGSDTIFGGAGADRIYGHEGDDDLQAGDGDDIVVGGTGSDAMDGGAGSDVISFSHDLRDAVQSGIRLNLADGTSSGRGDDSLAGFESVEGTSFDDVLIGNDAATTFIPSFGNDEVFAGGGDDIIIDHAPRYWPVAGNDLYDGGAGFDVLSWDGLIGEPIIADLASGTASGQGDDRFSSIEGLIGSERDDVLSGDEQDNILRGGDGDDNLDGRGGRDVLDGGPGIDVCLNGEEVTRCP